MSEIFSIEGRLYAALTLAADLVIITIAMVITSLPVITAGAATRAGVAVISRMLAGEGSRYLGMFFREFGKDWKPATGWFLGVAALSTFARYETHVIYQAQLSAALTAVFNAVVLSGMVVLAALTAWFYLLLVRDRQPFAPTLRMAAQHTTSYPARSLAAGMSLMLIVLAVIVAPQALGAIAAFGLIIGVGLQWYLALAALDAGQLRSVERSDDRCEDRCADRSIVRS